MAAIADGRFRSDRPVATIRRMQTEPGTPAHLRVVVIDADERVRESLVGLMCIGDRLEVVGDAGQPGPALDIVLATDPDIVVIDPRLPEMDGGLSFIEPVRAAAPRVRILVMVHRHRRWDGHRARGRWVRPQDVPAERSRRRRLRGRHPARHMIPGDGPLLDSAGPATRPQAHRARSRVTDSPTIRVLIVDDHSVVRMGLRMFFDHLSDIEVVGEATDGSEGVAMARRLEPDVVLMDLLMPNMDGVTAIGRIKAERPETEIVTMTSFIEEEQVTAALEAGASGYVLKDAEAEEVAAAVRAAYNGEVHLDPAVARLLAQRMRNRKAPDESLVEPLTDREKDVLNLLGQGMSNKEIGTALFITERTARTYVSNILGKLGSGVAGRRRRSTPSNTSWSSRPRLAHVERDARAQRAASRSPGCGSGARRPGVATRRSRRCRGRRGRARPATTTRSGPAAGSDSSAPTIV